MNKLEKVHSVIHTAAATAGTVGAGLAQIPGSDNAVITPIQLAMIQTIASIYGVEMSKSAALSALSAASAGVVGRGISQCLVGWIPGFGNAINASTAIAITESIGWATFAMFEDGGYS